MATIETRGEAVRVNWRLGGGRDGARQSCTFKGTPTARMKLAVAAKAVIESRSHNLTRDECYTAILGAKPVESVVPTFKQWVEDWVQHRSELRDIQPDVLKKYHQALTSRVVPFIGQMRLTDIRTEDLEAWMKWVSASRITIGSKNRRDGKTLIKAQTVRRTHAIVHACLAGAVPKWIPANPAARPAGSKKHAGLPKLGAFESIFLTPDEVRLIHDRCDPLIRDMMFVAVRSGLRLGELCALECRHVVFSRSGATLLVRQSLKNDRTIGPPKSEKSKRDVTVGAAVAAVLRERVTGKRAAALVFPSSTGKLWCENNFRERYWLRAVAAAQRCPEHPPPLPAKPKTGPRRKWRHDEVSTCDCPGRLLRTPRFHDLRHSHASLLIHQGWSAKKIQARLGHANYQTTMNIYGHLMDLGDEDELEGVDDLLDGKPAKRSGPAAGSARQRARRAAVQRLRVRR